MCLSSAGGVGSETRTLETFNQLEVSGNLNVEFYPDQNQFSAEISGGNKLIAGIETKVEDGVLKINDNNRCNWLRSYKNKMTVKIYGNQLSKLTYFAAGTLVFKDTLTTPTFLFEAWDASGDNTLLLNTQETYIKLHTGSANVTLAGKTNLAYYYSLSTGFIFGQGFRCNDGIIAQHGYGDMYINPTINLRGEITKIGNVYYPGNSKTDVLITGTGQLLTY